MKMKHFENSVSPMSGFHCDFQKVGVLCATQVVDGKQFRSMPGRCKYAMKCCDLTSSASGLI